MKNKHILYWIYLITTCLLLFTNGIEAKSNKKKVIGTKKNVKQAVLNPGSIKQKAAKRAKEKVKDQVKKKLINKAKKDLDATGKGNSGKTKSQISKETIMEMGGVLKGLTKNFGKIADEFEKVREKTTEQTAENEPEKGDTTKNEPVDQSADDIVEKASLMPESSQTEEPPDMDITPSISKETKKSGELTQEESKDFNFFGKEGIKYPKKNENEPDSSSSQDTNLKPIEKQPLSKALSQLSSSSDSASGSSFDSSSGYSSDSSSDSSTSLFPPPSSPRSSLPSSSYKKFKSKKGPASMADFVNLYSRFGPYSPEIYSENLIVDIEATKIKSIFDEGIEKCYMPNIIYVLQHHRPFNRPESSDLKNYLIGSLVKGLNGTKGGDSDADKCFYFTFKYTLENDVYFNDIAIMLLYGAANHSDPILQSLVFTESFRFSPKDQYFIQKIIGQRHVTLYQALQTFLSSVYNKDSCQIEDILKVLRVLSKQEIVDYLYYIFPKEIQDKNPEFLFKVAEIPEFNASELKDLINFSNKKEPNPDKTMQCYR